LNFQALNQVSQRGSDLAAMMKEITDNYNITYKIPNFILDSASNNLTFADDYKHLVDSSVSHNENHNRINKLLQFAGRRSLV
jgi:hypothetical protein